MNKKQAAEFLDVHPKTIERLISKGELSARKVSSRTGLVLDIDEQSLQVVKCAQELLRQRKAIRKDKIASFLLSPRASDEVFITTNLDQQRILVETPISNKLYGFFCFSISNESLPDQFNYLMELTTNCKKTYFYESKIDQNANLLITNTVHKKREAWEILIIEVLPVPELIRVLTSRSYMVYLFSLNYRFAPLMNQLREEWESMIESSEECRLSKRSRVQCKACFAPNVEEMNIWLRKEIIDKIRIKPFGNYEVEDMKQEILPQLAKSFLSHLRTGKIREIKSYLVPYLKSSAKNLNSTLIRRLQQRSKKNSLEKCQPQTWMEENIESASQINQELVSDILRILPPEDIEILKGALRGKDIEKTHESAFERKRVFDKIENYLKG